jgi:hypothetical protein
MASFKHFPKGDYHVERIARLVDLAQRAQDAADNANCTELRETWLRLAGQWAELATKAEQTADVVHGPNLHVVASAGSAS